MSKLLSLSNDVKLSLDSVDMTTTSDTIKTNDNNSYGVIQNGYYIKLGKIVYLSFEFLPSLKAIPAYAILKAAKDLPKPSTTRRLTGGVVDNVQTCLFYEVTTDGDLVLYNRKNDVIPMNYQIRSYGLTYIL